MIFQAVIVEDDPAFLKFVTFTLARFTFQEHRFQVTPFSSGRELLRHLMDHHVDLIFLDRLLPDASGFALCEKVKLRYPEILLVMFSTLGEAEDVIEGLHLGADDYLPKPFAAEMLTAKVTALLRRYRPEALESIICCGPLELHKSAHQVRLNGSPLQLTKTEFQLLCFMMERRGELVSHQDILTNILGYGESAEDMQQNIFFHMTSLRKKLGKERKRVQTVRGFGYRLLDDPSPPLPQ